MRMRKPLAMIAALATLLGGMAFGAASAQAANEATPALEPTDTKVVLKGSTQSADGDQFRADANDTYKYVSGNDTLRQFAYVKLATYEALRVFVWVWVVGCSYWLLASGEL